MKRIIISKSNGIGDVVAALPIAKQLKNLLPDCQIIFLGCTYTEYLIQQCKDVDVFIDWHKLEKLPDSTAVLELKKLHADVIMHILPVKRIAKLAKLAKIPLRIGTISRAYNLIYCNKLLHISRKKSQLHEAQNDLKYLKPLGGKKLYSLNSIKLSYNYKNFPKPNSLLADNKFNLILHPKTKGQATGHAREWPTSYYAELIKILPQDKFNILITGTEKEGEVVRKELIEPFSHVIDLTGKLNLQELMNLIANADGLIAASTGPVHLAASFGINTLGIYPPIRPLHAGRWQPIGKKAITLVKDIDCSDCRASFDCACIKSIKAQQVKNIILSWLN